MQNTQQYLISQSPSLHSRALNYGDGCFTTMLSTKGRVELLDEHVKRLISDAKKLSIFETTDDLLSVSLKKLINEEADNAYSEGAAENQIIKILIARGDSERGYMPSNTSLPIVFPTYQDYMAKTSHSISLAVAKMTLAEQSAIAGVKHLNRLEQVLAKMELHKLNDVDELLLTSNKGTMVELTSSNFFYRLDGVWHTPCLSKAGVNGVMRQFILRYMQQNNVHCVISEKSVADLENVEAAFSCNAVTKVVPISRIKLGDKIRDLQTFCCEELALEIQNEISQVSR